MINIYNINYFMQILELTTRNSLSLVHILQHADSYMPARKYYGVGIKHSTYLKLARYW